jgi:hypothetical protein
MQQKAFLWFGAAALLALAVACGGGNEKPASPTSPTVSSTVSGANATDDVTLKVSGPTLVSPRGGEQIATMTPALTFTAATGKYVSGESFTYRVQLLNAAGSNVLEEQTGKALAYTTKFAMDANTVYQWRARAELEGHYGAWVSTTFKSMERPTGYLKANEVYDPLIDGKTVGKISGPVTWLPGVGIRLEAEESSIEYALATTVVTGEFSMIVTNVGAGSGNDKAKIMAMREENGDSPAARTYLVDNDRRMTVEKRDDGNVAWRFITHDDQVDTIGNERKPAGVRDENTYLWSAIWNGVFTLKVQQLPGFVTTYEMGKGYNGPYDPNPHRAYVGSGTTFSGHGTVAGMIVRQVWLSPNPRPSWANQ